MNGHFRLSSPARSVARSDRPRPRRAGVRPAVEPLEGRALMSHAGSYDGSFGSNGTVTDPFDPSGAATDLINGQAIQADGKVVVVGSAGGQLAAIRLDSQGMPDPSFGGRGFVLVGPPASGYFGTSSSVLVLPNGQILAGGGIQAIATLYRLNPDGSIDRRFGIDGQSVLRSQFLTFVPTALAVRPDGKILAALGNGVVARLLASGAPGDYDNDGRTDVAIDLPSLGAFAYRPSGGGPDRIIPFGFAGPGGTIPAPGDYDGDGRTDLAAYLPSLGAFAIRPSTGGPDRIIPFGLPGVGRSLPVPGDYDGSGKTELAVYLPELGILAYRSVNGGPDVYIPFGAGGPGGTLPAPGDYSGSGKTEVAAYLPAFGAFAYRPANGGPDVVQTFGIAGPGLSIPVSEVPDPGVPTPTLAAASVDPDPGTTPPPKRKDALATVATALS